MARSTVGRMTHIHHTIDYIELNVVDLDGVQGVLRGGPSAGSSTTTAPTTPASATLAGDGEVGGLGVGRAARAGRLAGASSTPTTSRRAWRPSRRPGGTITEGPYEFPGGRRFLFTDNSGNLLAVWTPRVTRSVRRPDLGRARRDQRVPGRGGRARAAPHAAARPRLAVTAPPSSSSASVDDPAACRARAASSTQRGGVPGGASRSGLRRRSISSSATSGRHRATSRAASASAVSTRAPPQAAVGLADVDELPRPGVVRVPERPPRPRVAAPAPRRAGDHRLAGLERRGVQLARDRPARPGRPRRARPGRGARRPRRAACPGGGQTLGASSYPAGRPRGGWRRPPMIASTARSATTLPRSHAVPHHASRAEAGRGVVTGGEDTPGPRGPSLRLARMSAAVLEFADVTVRRGRATLIDRISWRVEEPDRWVILGPNGAGKTTLLQVASAMIHPTDGRGRDPRRGARHRRRLRAAAAHRRDQRGARRADPARGEGARRGGVGAATASSAAGARPTTSSTTSAPTSCSTRSARSGWPTARSAPSARGSASACRSPGR